MFGQGNTYRCSMCGRRGRVSKKLRARYLVIQDLVLTPHGCPNPHGQQLAGQVWSMHGVCTVDQNLRQSTLGRCWLWPLFDGWGWLGLAGWLHACPSGCLAVWLPGWLAGWLACWLAGWLTCPFRKLSSQMAPPAGASSCLPSCALIRPLDFQMDT